MNVSLWAEVGDWTLVFIPFKWGWKKEVFEGMRLMKLGPFLLTHSPSR